MKYKKYSYLIVFLLMLVIGIDNTYAAKQEKKCYYMSATAEEFNATLTLKWNYEPSWVNMTKDFALVYVDTVSGKFDHDDEPLANWIDWVFEGSSKPSSSGSPDFGYFYNSDSSLVKGTVTPECPEYLVFEYDEDVFFDDYYVWGTNSETMAKQAVEAAKSDDEFDVSYASYKNDAGEEITAEEYYGTFTDIGVIDDWTKVELECTDLFGDEDDPDSLHSMINTVMDYIRIIVPILVIVLGMVDLAKAVIAGKEDNMKKAQADFAKRVLMGVAVFFVPLLVDVMMDLAEIVWAGKNYDICQLIK